MSNSNIAFLGLGTMGAGMAANLLKAGFTLAVYNRTPAKAVALATLGARIANTPADAVKGAAIVIGMLADDGASREVWTGKDGALAAVGKGTLLVESSTLSVGWVSELAALAAQHGCELVDAPVTGSRLQAEAAQLLFLAGGSNVALEKAMPVLKAMGRDIAHLGPVGSGTKMKLINNFLCGVQVASLAEALAWIERSGLDCEKALEILKTGAPGSPLLAGISQRMVKHDYTVNFHLHLMAKDLLYAGNEAANEGVDLRTATAARALFDEACAKGYGSSDMSAVVEQLRAR